LNAMSELTRHNLELWGKMQESMLAAFNPPVPPPATTPSKSNSQDDEASEGSGSV
jgi:hypothetical protein